MTSWVEDIIQALENLGGYAHYTQIVDEVSRIIPDPLPINLKDIVQTQLQVHSDETDQFTGVAPFRNIGNGIWTLRDSFAKDRFFSRKNIYSNLQSGVDTTGPSSSVLNDWAFEIVQILQNLGGKASLKQIYDEFRSNHPEHLPSHWHQLIQGTLQTNTSEGLRFDGKHYFFRVEKGIWQLMGDPGLDFSTIELATPSRPPHLTTMNNVPILQNSLQTESFEDIENVLKTMKQYRDYYDPQSLSWNTYIREIFCILGFSVISINPRLVALNVIGANQEPKALVALIQPNENFDEIVPGLSWESYMLFAANFYQIEWGILTDGLKLKINRYQDHESKQFQHWPNLDEIITSGISATFATIYKIFSEIKQNVSMNEVPTETTEKHRLSDDLLNSNQKIVLVHEFLNQLLQKAKTKTQLHINARLAMHPRVCVNAGMRSMTYCYHVFWEISRVNLYINDGSKEWNKEQFSVLYKHKDEIEARFGGPLEWQLLPNRKASRIKYEISDYGVKDRDRWSDLQDQLIDAMIRLEKAFRPIIQSYR